MRLYSTASGTCMSYESDMTPYYQDGGQTIYNGDCLEIMKTFPDKSFDLVLTDPPYGIGAASEGFHNGTSGTKYDFSDWDLEPPKREVFDEMRRISKSQVIWGGNYFIDHLSSTRCMLFWDKGTGDNSYADGELAWTNLDSVVKKYGKTWVGANAKEKHGARLHPTQKPVELMQWCLSLFPDVQTILDPFLGSGTTLVAAKYLNRNATGIEISEKYCEIAKNRLAQQKLF